MVNPALRGAELLGRRRLVKICLLSDTHGWLDPALEPYLEQSDEVWHAGDFGPGVAESLQQRSRVLRGVYGNIDGPEVVHVYPESLRFECAGMRIWMIHIGGHPGRYAKGIGPQLKKDPPDIFICGHSHILRAEKDPRGNFLYLNPGACGRQGFHLVKTFFMLEILAARVTSLRVIELGPR